MVRASERRARGVVRHCAKERSRALRQWLLHRWSPGPTVRRVEAALLRSRRRADSLAPQFEDEDPRIFATCCAYADERRLVLVIDQFEELPVAKTSERAASGPSRAAIDERTTRGRCPSAGRLVPPTTSVRGSRGRLARGRHVLQRPPTSWNPRRRNPRAATGHLDAGCWPMLAE